MNKVSIGGYTRISKATARKLYNAGNDVYMLPCKMSPANMWQRPAKFNKSDYFTDHPVMMDGYNAAVPRNFEFDTVVCFYDAYNCDSAELGKYPAFYVREEA